MTRIYKETTTICEEPFAEVLGVGVACFVELMKGWWVVYFVCSSCFFYITFFALSRISFLVCFRAPTNVLGRKISLSATSMNRGPLCM